MMTFNSCRLNMIPEEINKHKKRLQLIIQSNLKIDRLVVRIFKLHINHCNRIDA